MQGMKQILSGIHIKFEKKNRKIVLHKNASKNVKYAFSFMLMSAIFQVWKP